MRFVHRPLVPIESQVESRSLGLPIIAAVVKKTKKKGGLDEVTYRHLRRKKDSNSDSLPSRPGGRLVGLIWLKLLLETRSFVLDSM